MSSARFIPCPDLAAEGNRQRKTRRAEPSGHRMGFAPTPLLDGGNAPARPQQPDILTFEGAASGRDKAFLIEYCGDLLVHFTGPV